MRVARREVEKSHEECENDLCREIYEALVENFIVVQYCIDGPI